MKTKNNIYLIAFFLLVGLSLNAQNLDRISISAGGASTDDVNYVLGETFNFSMGDGATVIIESGSLGSTGNTGSDSNFTDIKLISQNSPIKFYPNPAKDIVNLDLSVYKNNSKLLICIYTISGKIVKMVPAENKESQLDVSELTSGTYFISISDTKLQLKSSIQFIKE